MRGRGLITAEGVWALEPSAFARLVVAAERVDLAQLEARHALFERERDEHAALFERVGSVAVIPISGIISRGASLFGLLFGGEAPLPQIKQAVAAAVADESVEKILLAIDSPGGTALGLQDVADVIFAANRSKPVIAHTQGQMASAAYFLGSQAGRVFVSPEGIVGAIGTLWMVEDTSKMFERLGIKFHAIGSGPLKGAGVDGTKLTDEFKAEIQQMVDGTAAVFKAAVARGRRMSAERVEQLADGGAHVGAAAVANGLADRVATFDQTLAALGEGQAASGNDSARFVIAGESPANVENMMSFEKWLQARGHKLADLSDGERAKLEGEFKLAEAKSDLKGEKNIVAKLEEEAEAMLAEIVAKNQTPEVSAGGKKVADPPKAPPVIDITAAITAERARIAEVEAAGAGLEDVPGVSEIVAKAKQDGWSAERAKGVLYEKLRDSRCVEGGIAIHGERPDEQAVVRPWGAANNGASRPLSRAQAALAAGIMIRGGQDPVISAGPLRFLRSLGNQAEQERAATEGDRYSDMSMVDLCAASLRLSGRSVPSGRKAMIQAALSSGDTANIFTTNVSAVVLARYEAAPDTTQGWISEADKNDFKSNELIALDKAGPLKKLPRGGEAEHVKRGDTLESYKVARYAEQFAVDDQDIIDDRFDALNEIPAEMAESAAQLRPDLVFAILLSNDNLADGTALFDAGHGGNTLTGALNAARLQSGLAVIGSQQKNSRTLNLPVGFMIVQQAQEFDAEIILRSAERVGGTSPNTGTFNPLRAKNIRLIVDNRLSVGVTDPADGDVLGGDDTRWYLSSVRPMIEVGYIRGSDRRPTLRSFTFDKGRFGIGWDIHLDIGAKAIDFRGLFHSTGL